MNLVYFAEQPDLDSAEEEEEEEQQELSRYFSSMNGNGTLSRAVRIKCEPGTAGFL